LDTALDPEDQEMLLETLRLERLIQKIASEMCEDPESDYLRHDADAFRIPDSDDESEPIHLARKTKYIEEIDSSDQNQITHKSVDSTEKGLLTPGRRFPSPVRTFTVTGLFDLDVPQDGVDYGVDHEFDLICSGPNNKGASIVGHTKCLKESNVTVDDFTTTPENKFVFISMDQNDCENDWCDCALHNLLFKLEMVVIIPNDDTRKPSVQFLNKNQKAIK
jgi:hypothetical protein